MQYQTVSPNSAVSSREPAHLDESVGCSSATVDATSLPVSVRVLRNNREIEELRAAWMRLHRHPNSDIDFFFAVLGSSPSILRPFVLVLDHNEEPSVILVGRVETIRPDFRIGYAHLPRPSVCALVFIYAGLLGNPSSTDCELLVRAITGSLKQGEADIALFNHLRKDSPLYPAVLHQSGFFFHDFCPSLSVHRQLILPGSETEFWAGLSPKMRRNLRWQIKKLLNAYPGSVAIECFTKLCDLEEMIRQLECIATKTYQRGLGVGFVDTPGERAFMQLKMKRGWLRTYILSLNGKPSAFWSGTLYQGVFHSDYMGYDPACRQYSPGIFLLIKVIEMFCCQKADCKIEAVDFGLGDAKYKSYFADSHWLDASLWIYAPTIRGAALNAYRTSTLLADRIARRIVGEELQEKIKKLWRSRSARIEQAHSASSSEI
jgi:hypothetical protein